METSNNGIGGEENKDSTALTLQVRFITKQPQYAVPDYPFAVESKLTADELNSLINKILSEDKEEETISPTKRFDFLIGGEFLRGTLEELVLRHEGLLAQKLGLLETDKKVGTEEVVEIEYVESCPPPEPKNCLMHDDWVSALDANKKWILTGSYDNSLHLWSSKGKHKEAFTGHTGPVKAVTWISLSDTSAVFASASIDQTVMIWEWDLANNNISCKWACRGHARSVECLKSDPSGTMLASGSWDGELKFWSASPTFDKNKKDVEVLEPTSAEVDSSTEKIKTRTPFMTLSGHRENISGLDWAEEGHELYSSSWDHTLKIWDVEMQGVKQEIAGQKAFFGLSRSVQNSTLITASADRHIRLYDPRSNEGSLVKATFTSHSGWVSSVNWSKTDENLFISGSHDKLMKLWDRRSPRAPLYNMTGHTDNILCTSWANPKYMMSGGADNSLRLFNFKTGES